MLFTHTTDTIPEVGRDAERPVVTVLVDRCAGCQECIVRCPTEALSLDRGAWVAVADDDRCVGCRQCVRTCPFSAIVVEGPTQVAPRTHLATHEPDELAGDRTETRRGLTSWAEALAEATRCLVCPDPTCVRGCPAHNDIPSFIAALGRGDLDAAHAVLGRTTFLPEICGRVCDQAVQCEGSCTWSLAGGEPVAIGALERFVADNAPVPPLARRSTAGAGLDVAVVGSGPAGIAAASELCEAGARVTVYEKDESAGGLLRWGIPDFTLPSSLTQRPVDALVAAGVDIRLGVEVDVDHLETLLGHHDAVVVAAGAGQQLRLPVLGADLDRVWGSTRFLVEGQAALRDGVPLSPLTDTEPTSGRRSTVLVLGAGNTAMDVARTARRLGADAVCVDWMDPRFAPVRPDELAEAEAEGVQIRFSTTVDRLEGEHGSAQAAWLSRTRQRRASTPPEVVDRAVERIEVDLVVMAMGYRLEPAVAGAGHGTPLRKAVPDLPDRRWVASGLLATKAPVYARRQPVGALALGRESARVAAGMPRAPRVWLAGDALIGPSTVVEAMAQGKEAARGIIELRPQREPA